MKAGARGEASGKRRFCYLSRFMLFLSAMEVILIKMKKPANLNIRRRDAVFCLIFAASFCACQANSSITASYDYTNVRRGTIERTVSSSGTINPVATVRVLPQMSGKVEVVYVDYNDNVTRGDILARLNTDMLVLQRDQRSASVQKLRANIELQRINLNTQEALAQRELISEYDLRSSRNTLNNLIADLAIEEANLRVTETEINQYAYITSPITGIVLDRNINTGDTVVGGSSSNSATMFTIAENLREMQIEASVGELDISSIHKGQDVRFTLESLPGRRFMGTVENVRMVPVTSGGMVSYTVMISVENQDGSLMPGMTCAVEFIVERSENVMLVSNAALRYQPTSLTTEQISELVFNASLANMNEEQRQAAITSRAQASAQGQNRQGSNSSNQGGLASIMGGMGGARMMMPMGGGTRQTGTNQNRNAPVLRNLWYFTADGRLDVIQVLTGISDGTNTEIYLPVEQEGMQVILRERI